MTLLLGLAAHAATFDAPVISAPVDGAVVADPTPELRLDQVSSPAPLDYHIFVETLDDAPLLDAPATLDGSWASLQLLDAIAEDTWTCWYGVASDGIEEATSETACFFMTTTNDPPSAPQWLVAGVVGTSPVLEIQHGVDAEERGEVQILELYSETGLLLDQTEIPTSGAGVSSWEPSLEEDGLYRLRAQASDGLRVSPVSEIWILASDVNGAPSVPVLVSPKEGAEVDGQPVMAWLNSEDPEGDTLRYDIEVLDSTGEVINSVTDLEEAADRTRWEPAVTLEEGAESGWSDEAEFWVGPAGQTNPLDSEDPDSSNPRVGYAGGGGCSSAPGGALGGFGLVMVLGVLLRRRRR